MKIVTAGIIICNNKILITQRKRGKSLELLWEFPGGKLEEGETYEECLKREIKEELNIDVEVGEFFAETFFEYDFLSINLKAFFATCANQKICNEDVVEHEQYKWIAKEELPDYTFCPADIPIVEKLKQ